MFYQYLQFAIKVIAVFAIVSAVPLNGEEIMEAKMFPSTLQCSIGRLHLSAQYKESLSKTSFTLI